MNDTNAKAAALLQQKLANMRGGVENTPVNAGLLKAQVMAEVRKKGNKSISENKTSVSDSKKEIEELKKELNKIYLPWDNPLFIIAVPLNILIAVFVGTWYNRENREDIAQSQEDIKEARKVRKELREQLKQELREVRDLARGNGTLDLATLDRERFPLLSGANDRLQDAQQQRQNTAARDVPPTTPQQTPATQITNPTAVTPPNTTAGLNAQESSQSQGRENQALPRGLLKANDHVRRRDTTLAEGIVSYALTGARQYSLANGVQNADIDAFMQRFSKEDLNKILKDQLERVPGGVIDGARNLSDDQREKIFNAAMGAMQEIAISAKENPTLDIAQAFKEKMEKGFKENEIKLNNVKEMPEVTGPAVDLEKVARDAMMDGPDMSSSDLSQENATQSPQFMQKLSGLLSQVKDNANTKGIPDELLGQNDKTFFAEGTLANITFKPFSDVLRKVDSSEILRKIDISPEGLLSKALQKHIKEGSYTGDENEYVKGAGGASASAGQNERTALVQSTVFAFCNVIEAAARSYSDLTKVFEESLGNDKEWHEILGVEVDDNSVVMVGVDGQEPASTEKVARDAMMDEPDMSSSDLSQENATTPPQYSFTRVQLKSDKTFADLSGRYVDADMNEDTLQAFKEAHSELGNDVTVRCLVDVNTNKEFISFNIGGEEKVYKVQQEIQPVNAPIIPEQPVVEIGEDDTDLKVDDDDQPGGTNDLEDKNPEVFDSIKTVDANGVEQPEYLKEAIEIGGVMIRDGATIDEADKVSSQSIPGQKELTADNLPSQ